VNVGDKRGCGIALLFVAVVLAVVGVHDYRKRVYRYYNALEIKVWTESGIWHAAVSRKYVKGHSDEVRDAALAAIREALAQQLAEDFDPNVVGVKFDHRDIRDGVVTTYYVQSENR
jgi:hypothetical protein